MNRGKGPYKPRPIDRAVFAVLGVLNVLTGLYCAGPWYLDVTEGQKSTLLALVDSHWGVTIYGILLFLSGVALVFASASRGGTRLYARITSDALLAGFLLRLYAFIGGFLVIQSWRPPTYLSGSISIWILGVYWIWVRTNERPSK